MVVKLNTVRLNGASLNHASLNGVGERLRASAGGGGGEVTPPEEPDVPDVPVTYILSASASNGVVSASVNGNAVTLPYTANDGDVVIVEVTANDGYEFEGWSDGSTDNPRSITMTADVTLSATCVVKAVEKEYIEFEDTAVEAVLMANGVSSDGVGITKEDAAAVTSIGTWFKGNTDITSFNEFKYFTGIYLTSGMHNAFQNCTNLRSVELPILTTSGSVNSANGLFSGCTSLIHVTMAEGTNYVGFQWFANCSSMKGFRLPKSITQLGNNSFENCSSWDGEIDCPNLTTIGNYAFRKSGVKRVVNLGSVTTTSAQTFPGCPNLESVVLPDTLTDIGYYAFGDCPKLAYVDMPEGVATIGNQAFQNCTSLYFEYLNIPNVTVLNNKAFYGVKIKKMNISGVTSLPSASVNSYYYGDANTLEEIIVNENIPDVPNYSFFSYSKLRSFSAPNVTSIGERSFGGCSSLESVNLGDKFTSIGNTAFQNCLALKEIHLPSTLLTIGQQALGNCDFRVLDIPSSVTDISSIAFAGNKNMEYAVCRAITPPTLGMSAWNTTNNCPIYVPDAALEVYKTATNWSAYADRIHPLSELEGSPYITFADAEVERVLMENNVSSDGVGITMADAEAVTSIHTWFKGNTAITSFNELALFVNVRTLSAYAFESCTALASIDLVNVTAIESNAFGYCSSLSYVGSLAKVTFLRGNAFRDCANLKQEIEMPMLTEITSGDGQFRGAGITSFTARNLRNISLYMLYGCVNLKNVRLQAVETITNMAFANCTALEYIIIDNTTVPTLSHSNAFNKTNNCPIYVPDASVDAYKTASADWSTHASRIKPLSEYVES